MKKFVYIIFACLTIQSANAIENEDYYNRQFCTQVSGQAEYRLPDRSRVDCLTNHQSLTVFRPLLSIQQYIAQCIY